MQKQNRVSSLLGTIIILAVAIILFGGVFAYQYFFIKPLPAPTTTATQQILNKQFPLAGESVDSTAGWKTYTNTQYGFEIKYPPYWHSVDISSIHQNNVFAFCVEDSNDCNVNAVNISAYTPNGATDLLNDWRKQGSGYKEKTITIGGTSAVEREESYCQGAPLITNGIFVERNNYSLQIQGPISDCSLFNDKVQLDYPSADIIFNQMLSTFKFTR